MTIIDNQRGSCAEIVSRKNFIKRFYIGTYCLMPYARTENHIRDLSEAGIDLVFCIEYDKNVLDLLHKYNIGAIITNALPEEWYKVTEYGTQPSITVSDSATVQIERVNNHPAVFGINIVDEPSCLEFPFYIGLMDSIQPFFLGKLLFLNLCPSYGLLATNSPQQIKKELGTSDYKEYIESYCSQSKANYICFDHYVYSSTVSQFINDLRVNAEICRDKQKDLWIVLQVNSNDPLCCLSERQLRFQAMVAMCFGVKCISWACYTAGWWYHQVLDDQGNRTEQYPKLKNVNREIRSIATVYDQYSWVNTEQLDMGAILSWGPIKQMRVETETPILLGQFMSNIDHNVAIQICAIDDPYDKCPQQIIIRFQTDEEVSLCLYEANSNTKLTYTNGWYIIDTESNSGGFLVMNIN